MWHVKQRKKILFFSHAVTMAHFSRPLKWIEQLDPENYDIYLASDPKFKKLVPKTGVTFLDIHCIDAVQFSEIVGRAAPIYDRATFEAHIQEDMQIMDQVQPDVVIGDFRHSLSVSCRLKKIKYVNISNAYWSPDIALAYPLPEAPVIRALGEKLSASLMGLFIPFVLKLNFFKMAFMLRKSLHKAGLFFSDYRQVIIDGDVTLYCDTPGLIPLKKQEERERFVGPLVWSMPVQLPDWWSQLNPKKKRIFLSLGSSGPADCLPLIIQAVSKLDVELIVARAGKKMELPPLPNVHVTDFLPIEEACQNSDLIICNGGSPMCHAALTYGVPTIGIICNNDQLLNMAHIEKRGAGRMLRYWNLTAEKITNAVTEILENPTYAKSSEAIRSEFNAFNSSSELQNVIEEVLREEEVK
jgi:UDP:flavonoid glycosyltransferase YjiC (YdhE family)